LGQVQLSPILQGDAGDALDTICGAGGEGIILKRPDAPYRGTRTKSWLKVKCERRDDFIVIGWQDSPSRARPFASLLLMTEGGDYVGKVGTGFDGDTMSDLASRMEPLAIDTPAAKVPRVEAKGAHWIAPRLRAEISYAELTDTNRLRHPVYHGLRDDLEPPEMTRQTESDDAPRVAGVAISSPDRVIYPRPKVTKLQVAEYYEAIADRMLADTADRPLSLVRLPTGLDGERFFQKHAGKGFPDGLKPVEITEGDGDTATYMYVADAAGLVGGAQMGTLEYHLWGAHRDRLDRPDRMVFDLDPDEGLGFAKVRAAARSIRGELQEIGLESWPLITGGKGVHVVVPLRRTADWDRMTLFSRAFAQWLADDRPKEFTATLSKAKRKGRIFIDWLRNQRGSTAIAPFSLRARAGAPVAVPVTWEELESLKKADGFRMQAVLEDTDRRVPDIPANTLGAKAIEALDRRISG
jgi:bifunctional non-homologous end joining protein LigD